MAPQSEAEVAIGDVTITPWWTCLQLFIVLTAVLRLCDKGGTTRGRTNCPAPGSSGLFIIYPQYPNLAQVCIKSVVKYSNQSIKNLNNCLYFHSLLCHTYTNLHTKYQTNTSMFVESRTNTNVHRFQALTLPKFRIHHW